MGKSLFSVILILLNLCIISCSSGGWNAASPGTGDPEALNVSTGSLRCYGYWQVMIDKDGSVDVVDLRSSDLIINVLGFLEPPPMTNLRVKFNTLLIDPVDEIVEVDVVLTHPLPWPRYMGFDVRGVVFGPHVANADGYTIIPSPEFFSQAPLGYYDGILGTPDSIADFEGLAGYKYFCDGLGPDDDLSVFMYDWENINQRGVFSAGNKLTRHYVLEWKDSPYDFFVFNYAVYANYDDPVGPPPITIDDFPISTSNSGEAFCFTVTEYNNTLYHDGVTGGGSIDLQIEIWDWQGDISNTLIESVEDGVIALTPPDYSWPGELSVTYVYQFHDVPGYPTTLGGLDIRIEAMDSSTFGERWYAGLLDPGHPLFDHNISNYFIYTTTVAKG